MKKKISYLILICVMLLPVINVSAGGFSSNETISACGFGDYIPKGLPNFTSGLYNIVKLLVPIILIVMGMIDFTGAVMASEEKKMKDSQKKFINRLIAAIVVFLIMAVVQFVFKKIDVGTSYENGFVNCMNCLLSGSDTSCKAGTTDTRKKCTDYDIDENYPETDDYGNTCTMGTDENGNLSVIIKVEKCGTYNKDNCPVTSPIDGIYSCKVEGNYCVTVCEGLSYYACKTDSKTDGRCTWSGPPTGEGGKCIEK